MQVRSIRLLIAYLRTVNPVKIFCEDYHLQEFSCIIEHEVKLNLQNNYVRFEADCEYGLTQAQVDERVRQGLTNAVKTVSTKSYRRILTDNLFTVFNLINVVLAVLVLAVGSYQNALFICIILTNIIIGTVQEIRAKQCVDKLSLISAPRVDVMRDGKRLEIAVEDVVLDDILCLEAGGQICADCVVRSGVCEVDESLLTGEADAIVKRPGDALLSGSFVVAGSCCAQADQVGTESYAAQITADAKKFKKPNSELMRSLNYIIHTVSVLIVPIGILLFLKQYFLLDELVARAVTSTVAAMIGMIPEGLVLLTSIVLAVGVIRLSRHKTLVQELYCIETLARVDVLCVDKTGTITEGRMRVERVVTQNMSLTMEALGAMVHALTDNNPTICALREFAAVHPGWQTEDTVAFSSERKWSAAAFAGRGSFVMGAAEFMLAPAHALHTQIEGYAREGYRVLLLAHTAQPLCGNQIPAGLEPLSLVLLEDVIREEAPRTLAFFTEQGVEIKMISGDHAATASQIAQRAGLVHAENYVDMTTVAEEEIPAVAQKYTVFGRVTPRQKRMLVAALKAQRHTVAMTGDGVNDVLALKEADCSIALAAGSDAARNVSQLVLLDSSFQSLYHVVMEGRRAINNIQRSASLFLVKTTFSLLLSLLFLFIVAPYPFLPIHLTLISSLTVGCPSFVLALEPNRDRVQGHFLHNVLKRALPGGLTITTQIVLLTFAERALPMTQTQLSTVAAIATAFTAFVVLWKVCRPWNALRAVLFGAMAAAFTGTALLFHDLFMLATDFSGSMLILLAILVAVSIPLMRLYLWGVNKTADGIFAFVEKRARRKFSERP